MKYYSINRQSPDVDFKEATIRGQAPDKGLYFPERIPSLPKDFIAEIEKISDEEICYNVIRPYTGDTIPDDHLKQIVKETINFQIPLVSVTDSISSLELFHGPTLAFKDIGARFMSRCLSYFTQHDHKKITVLVATSGDTGGAVAHGFAGVEGVDVVILYPSGKVSSVQEKQLTTADNNIHALEVSGTFDNCQQMVKQAFMDTDLKEKLFLTSANSINVARWLPQQFYYFLAYKNWKNKDQPPIISVPSGNFGNICAGMIAQSSGLPVAHFIAACNANDMAAEYLETAIYSSREAVPTLSNAMDVGDPSNFIRILEIIAHQHNDTSKRFPALLQKLSASSVSDEETIETIARVYKNNNYLLEPHGAVAYLSLERYLHTHPLAKGIILETAHPVKFPDAVEKIIGMPIPLPDAIAEIMQRKKESVIIDPVYKDLKDYLLK